jgi:hypothetical protein
MSDAKDAQRASAMEGSRSDDLQEGDASLNSMFKPCCMHAMSFANDLYDVPKLLAYVYCQVLPRRVTPPDPRLVILQIVAAMSMAQNLLLPLLRLDR